MLTQLILKNKQPNGYYTTAIIFYLLRVLSLTSIVWFDPIFIKNSQII